LNAYAASKDSQLGRKWLCVATKSHT